MLKRCKKWRDRLYGGKADLRRPESFNQKQLKIRSKESTRPNVCLAQEIAMDHP